MNTPKKVIKTKPKTLSETDALESLRARLKAADSEIQNYVTALEAENLKLQKRVAKLQASNVTLTSRIAILEENMGQRCVRGTPPTECVRQIAQERTDALDEEIRKASEELTNLLRPTRQEGDSFS